VSVRVDKCYLTTLPSFGQLAWRCSKHSTEGSSHMSRVGKTGAVSSLCRAHISNEFSARELQPEPKNIRTQWDTDRLREQSMADSARVGRLILARLCGLEFATLRAGSQTQVGGPTSCRIPSVHRD